MIVYRERRSVTLKREQNRRSRSGIVITDELLDVKLLKTSGPSGKVRLVFEQVSRLPRKQQAKVVEFVEAFVSHKAASS